ncbi:MAG: peptide chain release factor-like protein [Planctomycetes bacterium]|nr:peptide chain release factor-like protein [Planctomycetota bacterium]
MKFPADTPVTAAKLEDLRARITRLGVRLDLVEESFVRSPGPGGQKVNKTSSAVFLRYPPLDLTVKCSRERSRALNRFLALRELVDEIEARVSPGTSERLKERERIRARKRRRGRRAGS